jgi:hypothetical protein
MFDKLSLLVRELQNSDLVKQPDQIIESYFASLREKIDLHQSQMIEQIEKRSQELKLSLTDLETECKLNKPIASKAIKLNTNIKLDAWRDELKMPGLGTQRLDELTAQIQSSLNDLQTGHQTFKAQLLQNKEVTFEPMWDAKLFGQLRINALSKVNTREPLFSQLRRRIDCLRTFKGHSNWVSCLAVDETSGKLFTGSWDSTIKVFSHFF